MKLMLPNPPFDTNFKIAHKHQLFFIGSCFSETMNKYFEERKFVTATNPHGVLYNPLSISKSLQDIIHETPIDTAAIVESDAGFQSFHHHSCIKGATAHELVDSIESINKLIYQFLKSTDVIFITLGTAWVYWHKELQQVVANNLRAPSTSFERKLLTIQEITNNLWELIKGLRAFNSDIKVVFTISPVRHAKQGLVENNRSKARLLEAVHQLHDEDDELNYLPSYELVLDVLRDYRFYKKDLVHPNEQALDYIWEYILGHIIIEGDKPLVEKLLKISMAVNHKMFNPQSDTSKIFQIAQLKAIEEIEKEYSYINMMVEKKYFENL